MINIKFHENDLNLLLEILGCVYLLPLLSKLHENWVDTLYPPLCLCVKKKLQSREIKR